MNKETALAKIEIRVEDDEGNIDVETPWVTPVGHDRYRLENSPFYAYNVSWEDIVEGKIEDAEGFPVFTKVLEMSGNRTVRVIFNPPIKEGNRSQDILNGLTDLGCSYEGANRSYIVINIPKDIDLMKIRDYLLSKDVQWEHADPSYSKLFPNE